MKTTRRLICKLRGHNWVKRDRSILLGIDGDPVDVTVFGTNPVRCQRCGRTTA
jgi:inorganic pyrophosphatase